MSTVSLILPVYNGSQGIVRCLNSIIRQSYENFDLLIIDDGSNDDSSEIIETYLDKLEKKIRCKIKFLRQENQGVSRTRNIGIQMVDGEWIGFIDQDDYISRDYIKKYVLSIQNSEKSGYKVDVLVGGYDRVADNGKVIRHEVLKGKNWDKYVVVSPWAHLYRRQFLIDNNIYFLETKIGEDVFFNLKAYAHTDHIIVLKNNCGYKWVFNSSSVSNSKQNRVTEQNDPSLLLNAIIKMYREDEGIKTPYAEQEYYITRYVVWYCIFTFKDSKRKEHKKREKELFWLLKSYYPKYYKNKHLWRKIEGEPLKIYLAVTGYLLLHSVGLV